MDELYERIRSTHDLKHDQDILSLFPENARPHVVTLRNWKSGKGLDIENLNRLLSLLRPPLTAAQCLRFPDRDDRLKAIENRLRAIESKFDPKKGDAGHFR